jgi:DNA-binding winged helix-turn-helix (wHTH) protein
MDEIIIGDIIFTPKKRMINKGGSIVKIRNKESEVLSLLCHHYPSSISREDIEKKIWEGSYVTDNTLTQTISNLRNALDDKEHELVTTIPKKGYCIGVKPGFISSNSRQNLLFTNSDVIDGAKSEAISIEPKFGGFYCKAIMLIILIFSFIFSFDMTSNYHQIKIKDVNSLPILMDLDVIRDKNFLSLYQKEPYIFLKKRRNGEYIACKYQEGELICEQK